MKPRKPRRIAPSTTSSASNGGSLNLMDTALEVTRLSAFQRAARTAGLSKLLSGSGPFTVFAPTDKAFAKMPKAELDALFADEKELNRVLSLHIVSARVKAPAIDTAHAAATISGEDISISRNATGYHVNGARIVKTRIRASNGVIHAIDTVLVPS